MTIIARHYETGYPVEVEIQGTRFGRIRELNAPENESELPWIAPGLIDLQINGFGGVDFNALRRASATDAEKPEDEGYVEGLGEAEQEWQQATDALYAAGCTGFLVTLITTSSDGYAYLLPKWTACMQQNPRNGLGLHLEGPWLNPEDGYRGAHSSEHILPPDVNLLKHWIEVSGGAVRMITLAPEMDPAAAGELIAEATQQNILTFLGHSAAMGETLRAAVDLGARGWTHLGNAAPRVTDKFENVIFHVLAETRLYASLIPDGLHLPAHVFRALSQALGDQMILTTDAMSAAGANLVPEGGLERPFTLGEIVVQLSEDGSARMPETGRLAGSTLTPFEGVCRAAEMSELPWPLVWNAFSKTPAELLGFKHGLEEGNSADFCLLPPEDDPRLIATYHRGEQVFRTE